MIKLNKSLENKYKVTDKVILGKFEHRYLGRIDLEKIDEKMAERLVKTGHLKRIAEPKERPQAPAKDKQ